jgi:2,4-dienoyl-CoA reductase-like NADH-dependent reductase (Old Yellow Enzyme family)
MFRSPALAVSLDRDGPSGSVARVSLTSELAVLSEGRIGPLVTRNRIIRSATSESMADPGGFITDAYRRLHLRLARAHVGLIFTGHCAVHRSGRYIRGMTEVTSDEHVPVLRTFTDAIHAEGARIFAELNHAGSQSRVPDMTPIAPSVVPNPQFHRTPREASDAEIRELIDAFARGARRVREAGFDGVHVHAGHGYLISEFLSPVANRRTDAWGGSLENRQRFGLEVFRAMRGTVGSDFPITWKLGLKDFVPGGLPLEDGLATAVMFDREGVDAIEGSAGLMSPAAESAVQYAGVSRRRALDDKLLHRLLAKPRPGAYFYDWARMLRERVRCRVILVGGLRSVEVMERAITDGVADFVSLARPLIREPDLVAEIEQGRRGEFACTSCNICLMHEGVHHLRCWRTSNRALAEHAVHRLAGHLT